MKRNRVSSLLKPARDSIYDCSTDQRQKRRLGVLYILFIISMLFWTIHMTTPVEIVRQTSTLSWDWSTKVHLHGKDVFEGETSFKSGKSLWAKTFQIPFIKNLGNNLKVLLDIDNLFVQRRKVQFRKSIGVWQSFLNFLFSLYRPLRSFGWSRKNERERKSLLKLVLHCVANVFPASLRRLRNQEIGTRASFQHRRIISKPATPNPNCVK